MRRFISWVMLLLLLGCGKYDPGTGSAIEPPETVAEEPTAEVPEQPVPVQTAPTIPPPDPSDEEIQQTQALQKTAGRIGLSIVATIQGGLTKVKITEGEEQQQFMFSSTNQDNVIQRVATRLQLPAEEIASLIVFEGDGLESHSR